MSSHDSALVVLVPEAEDLVRPFREKDDPWAATEPERHSPQAWDEIPDRLHRLL
jgi:hypothetical protein